MIYDLGRYLVPLYVTIHSRQEIEIEESEILDQSAMTGRTGELSMRLCFWDGSLLQVEEALVVQAFAIVKVRYNYHYQHANGRRIFRYDNAPHHPDLTAFPEPKHAGDRVHAAPAPDLCQVLKEIDGYLYPDMGTGKGGSVVGDRTILSHLSRKSESIFRPCRNPGGLYPVSI